MKCHSLTLLVSALICVRLWGQNNDWTVVYLHPEGANESQANAAAGRWQGGYKSSGGNNADAHPILWKSRQDGYVDLLPSNLRMGIVHGVDSYTQFGEARGADIDPFALLWSSTPLDFVDLSPGPPYTCAYGMAVSRGEQVGYVCDSQSGRYHAALWHSTPESFVDLHPAVARESAAVATDGECQGGAAAIPRPVNQVHAALWHGSASTFLDMHPYGAKESHILGMAPGVQVGWEWVGTLHKAILWHGTPESAVVMHPSNAYYSYLLATNGTTHAGYITTMSSCAQAGLWTGDDPESFFNLSVYLPPDWYCSTANAISQDKGRLYVAGTAESPEGVLEAVVWIGPAKPKTARPQNAKPDPAPRPEPAPRPAPQPRPDPAPRPAPQPAP